MKHPKTETTDQTHLPHGAPLSAPLPSVFRQGQTVKRPPRNSSQAHGGIEPLNAFANGSQKFEPLPEPLGHPPYHYQLSSAIPDIEAAAHSAGKLVFHVVGDTGGVKSPDYQANVAAAMKADLNKPAGEAPAFFYHLGDVVYYNGQIGEYYNQFYEPYNHYNVPIIAIPGNHDGSPIDTSQTSLDGWVRYFMTAKAHVNSESQDAPRATMSLPNPYFTVQAPFVTIVGMYTNVPEGGSIDSVQQQWLTNEFATAPEDKALIVALHHPIYSFDDHHSGSARMADAVQHAINDSRRVPNMVLSAHVHNYQRIERSIVPNTPTPFLVIGNGGYYHLHGMNIDTPAPGQKNKAHDLATGAQLLNSNHNNHGYSTFTVDAEKISVVVSLVEEHKYPAAPEFESFSYTAKLLKLAEGAVVSL